MHQSRYTTRLGSFNHQIPQSNQKDTRTPGYLPPRVVRDLVLGRSVLGGGGDRATSFQSLEPRGGKPTPGTFGGGRSLSGDMGVGSTLSSLISSSGSLSDTEAIERVMSLETK